MSAAKENFNQAEDQLNKIRVATAFAESANSYDAVAGLQRKVGGSLMDKAALHMTQVTQEPFPGGYKVLDLGAGTGYFSEKIVQDWQVEAISLDIAYGMLSYARQHRSSLQAQNFICADAEKLPITENTLDMVFSNFALQWCDDLAGVFQQVKKILKPGGLFLFSLPVDGTLKELKSSWQSVDQYRHVNEFYSLDHVQAMARDIFHEAKDISLYSEEFVLYYQQVQALSRELKALGANQVKVAKKGKDRSSVLMGRRGLKKLLHAYEQFRNEKGLLPATYKVASGFIEMNR